MKCPNCKSTSVSVEDADGFSQDSRECSKCGCVWTFSGEERKIIKDGEVAEYLRHEIDSLRLAVTKLENRILYLERKNFSCR